MLFRKKKNQVRKTKASTALKQQWRIRQLDNRLKIEMQFQEDIQVQSLVLRNTVLDIEKHLSVQQVNGKYVCNLNLEKVMTVLKAEQELFEQSSMYLEDEELQKRKTGMWSWYVNFSVDGQQANEQFLERIETQMEKQQEKKVQLESEGADVNDYTYWRKRGHTFERYLRLGRFANTIETEGLKEQTINDHTILTYLNAHGYLVTAVDEEVTSKTKLQIENLKTRKGKVEITGLLNTAYFNAEGCRAVLKSRNTTEEIFVATQLERRDEMFRNRHGRVSYDFKLIIDFQALLALREDVYDLFLEADMPYSQEPVRFRVGRPTFRAKHFFGEVIGDHGTHVMLVNPYYTVSRSNLSFEVFPLVKENYKYLQDVQKNANRLQQINRNKDVWIVGERPYKAQDTGYHFFKYMREKHPERNVYYVITEDSPERKKVEKLGNVLLFGSKEHIKNTMVATKVFSSHHPDYLFPLRTEKFKNKVKATKIFIQHGVLGLKKLNHMYSVNSKTFDTDLFITSSDYEKQYIMNDMGYKSNEVVVTGLSRFDALFANDVEVKKQILIIPTWREWVQNIESFLESEYYERYLSLVNNDRLIQHAKKHQYEIVLCLHPNMQNFSSYFEGSPVKIVYQGEVDVQTLIKESALMVTDYSSVAFDFSFLHKPVVYYQFDRNQFIGKRGSHIDIDNDLPGEILEDEDELIMKIQEYVENNCIMKNEYKEKANRFIKYRDTNASKRIYEEALRYKKDEKVMDKLSKNKFLIDVFTKFRKSKRYFPTMKKMYTAMRILLPIDQKKVLLESGIGKNFSDSPKEIFEVLQHERKDLKFIWVYNKNLPKAYENTSVIKRLSPAYYYHLATSKYWVNNQNFPTYIQKPKGTTYLQTWHGTPLKRMLHDIQEIHGRDETYLERVSGAVKNWDYLISPSEYATNCFKSAFQYKGEVIEEGYPRNDIFYRKQNDWDMRELKQKLQIPQDKKVILYAPTFRDNQKKGKRFTMELPIDFETFQQQLGDEYVLLIRLHVVVSKKVKIDEEYKDTIINVSNYPDIQELMMLSDLLITDYSSVFFDYLNTSKPILFYTYDLEEYRDQLRGFYMDFEHEAPGPLCLTEESLYDAILHLNETKAQYAQRYDAAKNRFCYLDDGHATERVVQKVFEK